MCGRWDVQAHHLVVRSRGGGHEDENLKSLCTWCHLFGVHGGRLGATGPASNVTWTIGRFPVIVVAGRDKRAA